MPIPIDDNQPWWRYRRVEDKGQLTLRSALKKRADDILARPNARFPNGSFNPRVVSREDARIVSQAYPRVAEQQGRPGQAITGFEALGNLGGRALTTGLEAIAETGLAGTQALADIGPNFPAPLSFRKRSESEQRSRESFQTIKRAVTGRQPVGEAITELAQRQRERPLPEQFAAGAIYDPFNLLPGVGFGPEIARGVRAVGGVARRGAEAALVRAPGEVLPKLALKVAGKPSVAGAAPIALTKAEAPARITRFLKPEVQSQWKDLMATADDMGIKTEAVAGVLPDEYFIVLERTGMTRGRDKVVSAFNPSDPNVRTFRRLFFGNMEDARTFLNTGEYTPPSLRFGGRPIENIKPEYVSRQFPVEKAETASSRAAELRRAARRPQMGESLVPPRGTEETRLKALNKLKQEGLDISVLPEAPPTKPVAPVTKAVQPTRGQVVPSPRALLDTQGGYLTESDDIPAMVAKHGEFAVVVKDVNGARAVMNATDFAAARENPAFAERIREVFVQRDITPVTKPEFQEGFMASLRAEEAGIPPSFRQLGTLEDIGGIKLNNVARSVTPSQQGKFVDLITDNEIRGLLKQSGVTEVRIEPSYKFGLSEQANLDKKTGVLSINADVENARDTVLHELGHDALERMSANEKARFIEKARVSSNPIVAGYQRVNAFEEAAAELMFKDTSFNPSARGGVVPSRTWETGAERPFAFDPNSTANQGRFRLLPAKPQGKYITRQSGTPGVSYIVDTETNAIQSVRFNKAQFPEAKATEWWEANKGRFKFSNQAEVAGVTPSTRAVPESIVSPAAPGGAAEPVSVPVRRTRATRTPPPSHPQEESTAAGVRPPSPAAAPPGGGPPRRPPTTASPPPADPIQARPRTLVDMNREAKGMRAMTPEQRAAVMDLAKPIEGDILYQARPFNEHAQNLLGPDTNFMKALRRLPGLKQVYGVWNPAQMARDNPQAMIGLRQSIFQEIEKARIRFVTLRWWHEADNAFEFKQFETAYGLKPTTGVWRATKVQSAPGVVRGKMFGTFNDMIEHPERYVFTDDQTKVLYLADNTLTQSVRDAQRAGVNVVEIAEEYWPRIVTKGPKGEKGFGIARKRVSSAKGYTRQRAFSDIDDLVAAGYTVETDPRRVLASRLEAGVDTIAHANSRKQIAALPGVEKPLERMERRFPQVLESARGARAARDAAKVTVKGAGEKVTTEQVMALRQAEADYITAMREVFAKKVEAGMPGYYELRLPNGRIAPQELVDQVGKLIDLPELRQAGEGAAARLTQEVSQLLRTTLTNVDTAAGFIQGQSLFYRNNIVWWKAQMQAGLALLDDPTAFVVENFDLMDEGVRTGTIVAPTEFLFAKQGIASIPLRIPYIGPGLGAFNRVFEWFITAGQTYLYKAARSGVAKNAGMDELVSLGSAIRKEVGTESYAILGVRPNQRTFEALSLFAARFFRANVGLLGQSFTPGPGGAEARKAVGSLLAGGMAVTIGIKWAQDRELPNMTDPYAPDWMQWRWGKTYHNAYGPFYPYLRTMARVSVSLGKGNPMKAAGEIKRFLTSKESLPLRAIDIAGQLIYYGSANVYGTKIEKQWLSIVKGILSEFVTPISLQEIPSGIAEGRPESVLEFGGLIGRPVRMASEWAKDLQSYWDIPTSPLELKKGQLSREKYREANPEVDAKLFITGAVSSLIARKSNFTGMTIAPAVDIALALIRENDINPDDIRGITARKKLLAEYRKAGLDPPESRGVDRLIVLLGQTPSSTSQQPMPTPSTSGTGSSTWERMKQPATTPSSSSTWERMKQSTSKSPSSSVWDRMKQSATPVGVR